MLAEALQASLSTAERSYIVTGCGENLREDGRSRSQLRPMTVENEVLPRCNGSARVQVGYGSTDVLVGVKLEVGAPSAATPGEGRIEVGVEVSPACGPRVDERRLGDLGELLSQRLAGLVASRGGGLPARELCIIPGKYCWVVGVDVVVLAADGGVLDAASMGLYVALSSSRVPRVDLVAGRDGKPDEFELSPDYGEAQRLPVGDLPVVLSFCQVGGALLLDATAREERCADCMLSVAVDARGGVRGVSKTGGGKLAGESLAAAAEAAAEVSREVFGHLQEHVRRMQEADDAHPDAAPERAGMLL